MVGVSQIPFFDEYDILLKLYSGYHVPSITDHTETISHGRLLEMLSQSSIRDSCIFPSHSPTRATKPCRATRDPCPPQTSFAVGDGRVGRSELLVRMRRRAYISDVSTYRTSNSMPALCVSGRV